MISDEVKCSGLFIFTRAVNTEKKDGGESMLGMFDQHMETSYIRWIYEPQVQQFVHIVQLDPTSVLAYLTSSVYLSENVPGAFFKCLQLFLHRLKAQVTCAEILLMCLTNGVGSDMCYNVWGRARKKAAEKGKEAWIVYCMLMRNPAPSTDHKKKPLLLLCSSLFDFTERKWFRTYLLFVVKQHLFCRYSLSLGLCDSIWNLECRTVGSLYCTYPCLSAPETVFSLRLAGDVFNLNN